jgi:hypothetical protein
VTELKDKIEIAIGESRLLILGVQVLIGLQYRSVFETGFKKLSPLAQDAKLVGLLLLLFATVLIFAPAPYHRIVEEGENSLQFHRFVTRAMEIALMPLALGLGIDLYVAGLRIATPKIAMFLGIAGAGGALLLWYVWGLAKKKRANRKPSMTAKKEQLKPTEITEKVKHLLLEGRMVLPGVQALLGFQFAVILVEGFEKLSPTLKYIHLASLCLMSISTILLIAPAAYHRIVEEGEATEKFHRLGSRLLLLALVPLAAGMCGDLFVVIKHVTASTTLAAIVSGVMLLFFYGLWFGYSYYRRGQEFASKRQSRVLQFSRTS